MKVGILGSTSAHETVGGMGAISHEDDVLATDAFIEAAELAHESESDYADMVQATVVGAKLDTQAALADTMLGKPESITSGTVMMARESMELALVALGGGVSDYQVSTESMESAPLQALEVTTEGIKDVSKKIYESIKMVFKKIALAMKKLAAKLVVAMDGTSKKAKAMTKSFAIDNAGKVAKKFEEKTASKLVKRSAGFNLLAGKYSGATNVVSKLTANLVVVTEYTAAVLADYTALAAAVVTARVGLKGTEEEHTKPELQIINDELKQLNPKTLAFVAAKARANNSTDKIDFKGIDGGAVAIDLTSDQLDETSAPDGATNVVFYPTFTKGDKIHGVIFYTAELESGQDPTIDGLLHTIEYTNTSVTAYDESALESQGKALQVMSTSEITNKLDSLKDASKTIKSFSDARFKEIDGLNKEMDKAAKASSGLSVFNRLSGKQFNKTRMFVAGNYISSVFATASHYRNELATVAAHIGQYE